jgi:serpin B
MTVQEVELTMPKFKLTWERRLNDDLRAMGMRTPFVEGGADFTPLSPTNGRKLFISFVKQNTYVDVNEVGTEAAAVTTVGVGIVSLPQRLVVRVDRPFVFALRERLSGTVLFLGRIVRL